MASKSAKYYASHPEARRRKNKYQTKYESTPAQRAYRSKLSVIRRKRKLKGDARDLSHKADGSIVLEARSKNRARNNSGNNGRLKP